MAQLLTAAEVAKQLKVTEGTVRKWAMLKKIPFNKLGKSLRFDQNKIDNWVNQRSVRIRVGDMTL